MLEKAILKRDFRESKTESLLGKEGDIVTIVSCNVEGCYRVVTESQDYLVEHDHVEIIKEGGLSLKKISQSVNLEKEDLELLRDTWINRALRHLDRDSESYDLSLEKALALLQRAKAVNYVIEQGELR